MHLNPSLLQKNIISSDSKLSSEAVLKPLLMYCCEEVERRAARSLRKRQSLEAERVDIPISGEVERFVEESAQTGNIYSAQK
jgi:hypothetical protein